ncbi:MAG: TetR/AcrR family transcriptional regulator [Deltaproteobacteria bacterium]|nr:MAG: TetR/AcrR family transcriptional regulator [Deltaproteobacteria bacterium]
MPTAVTRRRKPKQARSREKVERILSAARSILVNEGPIAFNTNRVAKEAKVGVGSLYEYFPNKESIAQRLLEDIERSESDAILQRFAELTEASLHEAIVAIVETTFALYQKHSHLYQALRTVTGEARRREGIRPTETAIVQATQERLKPHQDTLQVRDLELTSLLIFYTVESLAFSSVTHQPSPWTDQQWIDEIVAVVYGYLGLPANQPST